MPSLTLKIEQQLGIDLIPPKQSWDEFVESLRKNRRPPQLQDLVDRWDKRRYTCPKIHNRRPNDDLEHVKDFLSHPDTKATCGGCGERMVDVGPAGIGEQRAYLAWLLGLMDCAEEAGVFMQFLRPDVLLMVAMVPVMRALMEGSNGQ